MTPITVVNAKLHFCRQIGLYGVIHFPTMDNTQFDPSTMEENYRLE